MSLVPMLPCSENASPAYVACTVMLKNGWAGYCAVITADDTAMPTHIVHKNKRLNKIRKGSKERTVAKHKVFCGRRQHDRESAGKVNHASVANSNAVKDRGSEQVATRMHIHNNTRDELELTIVAADHQANIHQRIGGVEGVIGHTRHAVQRGLGVSYDETDRRLRQ